MKLNPALSSEQEITNPFVALMEIVLNSSNVDDSGNATDSGDLGGRCEEEEEKQ